jgi:D-alanyl-D-alanine carboxypeptidase
MVSRLRLAAPALLVLLAAGCAGSRDRQGLPPAGRPGGGGPAAGGQDRELLQRLVEQVRGDREAPGAVLAVAVGDGPVAVVASGVADRATGRPMLPGTPCFLGSITKTYTAVVILRLAEEGRLSLDDPVARFLPDFPDGALITVRHLLSHTSGLKDFYSYFYYRPDREEMIALVTKRWTQEELLELSGRFGRWFDPGTDWDYSSTNYFLLGVIAERAGGQPLAAAYRRVIAEPLGLRHTWLAEHEAPRGLLPVGYMGPVEGWKHSEMFGALGATTVLDRSSAEWSTGGLAAPAEEAVRFLRGLFAGKLLSRASLAALQQFRSIPALGHFSPSTAPPSRFEGYGLGLLKMERAGVTLLGHGGLFTGHAAGLWYIPEHDLTFALCFNRGLIDQRPAYDRVVAALTGSP